MFCPACGATNAENARFCNQCGARMASMLPVEGTAPGAGSKAAEAPVGESPPPPREPSLQGTLQGPKEGATRSQQGFSTAERVELPMVGPSKRTLGLVGAGLVIGGAALGALLAWRAVRRDDPAPVTPVGLLGEPTAVPSGAGDGGAGDGGALLAPNVLTQRGNGNNGNGRAPARPPARPATGGGAGQGTNVAANTGTNPGTNPGAPPEQNPTPGGANTDPGTGGSGAANPTPGNEPGGSSAGATDAADAGGTTVASAGGPAPTEPTGVVERIPGQSRGGYRMGEETDATGTMDPQAFSYVYRHHQSQIATCYSSASRTRENVAGVIVVRVRVGEDGHVRRTRVISDTAGVPSLTQCVQTEISRWRYPQPEGGEVEVDYPLRFGGAR